MARYSLRIDSRSARAYNAYNYVGDRADAMKTPNPTHLHLARTLFAHEANGAKSADELTAAAGRIHQKVFARLAPLLGVAGTRALFARSVKLTAPNFPCFRGVHVDADSADNPTGPLVTCLHGEAPAAIGEITAELTATLLTLLATLIGDRLTFQVLRGAWPMFDVGAANEETK